MFTNRRWHKGRKRWACFALGVILFAGCRAENSPQPNHKSDQPPASRASVALRLLVVNDGPLAEAIGRLRGEWSERSGGTLTTSAVAWLELVAGESPDADVVIFPSRYLGELCEKKWLRPVRDNVLQSSAFNAGDIFPLVRQRLMTYDKQVFAVPLGIDLPVMCYRGEFFGANRRPPQSWADYIALVRSVRASGIDASPPAASLPAVWEPLRSWDAVMLMARVASYASHQDKMDVLFDNQTMKPRIADTVFIRAMKEMLEAHIGVNREAASELDRKLQDPRAASWHLATGYTQFLSIGLPPAGHRSIIVAEPSKPFPAKVNAIIRWTRMPAANEVYHSTQGWQKLDRVHYAPLLAVGDRLAAVTTSSRNAATAFQLLLWLAEPEVSSQFARAGNGTMPVRRSLASSPRWYDEQVVAQERADLAAVLSASLGGEECLVVPRIPGVDEYLAALAEAVEDVVLEKAEPQAALEKAASTWELITEKRGREAQRQAYLRHLGLDSK